MNRTVFLCLWIAMLTLATVSGCKTTKKYFAITTFPEGAKIFVDGEPRGYTNVEKLAVDFKVPRPVLLRVEKEGYQSEGSILLKESSTQLAFFLKESPKNEEVIRAINNIRRKIDTLSSRVEEDILEKRRAKLQE